MQTKPQPEMLQETSEIHQRLSILAQLASSLSHAIHNPLSVIALHADILQEELAQSDSGNCDQREQSLAALKRATARLQDMIQEYLTLARLTALSCEPEDLGALLNAFVLETREQLTTHGIHLHLEGMDDLGPVALHRQTFRHALRKAIQHAIEAMPHGGTLTLQGQRADSHLRLEISDTGAGLSEAQLALVCSPAPAIAAPETGLGLYLMREIVQAHGGKMTVTSTPAKGTTLTITLPLCR